VTTVAVLGGGAGGASAAVELTRAGHSVRLWNRNRATIAPHVEDSGIRHTGVLGDGLTPISHVGTDLGDALAGADVAVVCLPALAHGALFADLAALGSPPPLVLNPGHTGGALHARRAWTSRGLVAPPIVEFSTLTYVARKNSAGVVAVTGRAARLRMAALAAAVAEEEAALALAGSLWPAAVAEPDVLATSLANVNLVLHPPAAVLGAAWVEATGGDFRFYADATTPAVAAVMASLDAERRAVAAAFGHALPALLDEMLGLGTVEPFEGDPADPDVVRAAVAGGRANAAIMAPSSLEHRYYREDFAFGVVPFTGFAGAAGVPTPTATALLGLADAMLGGSPSRDGLTLERLGLGGLDAAGIRAHVRPHTSATTGVTA
jgi:opine dehydrogenase